MSSFKFIASFMGRHSQDGSRVSKRTKKSDLIDLRDFSTSEFQIVDVYDRQAADSSSSSAPSSECQQQKQQHPLQQHYRKSHQRASDQGSVCSSEDSCSSTTRISSATGAEGTESPTIFRRCLQEYSCARSKKSLLSSPLPVVGYETSHEDVVLDEDVSLDVGLTV